MLTALADVIPTLKRTRHQQTRFIRFIFGLSSSAQHDPEPVSCSIGRAPESRTLDSLRAGERALEFVSSLNEDDTLVCLISGGGSALVTAPYEGISLEDMQTLTSLLLSSGARIDEINILRRQLDRVKGGGLARATKAKVISLIFPM